MPKKLDFDNTIKKVEGISSQVDIIMRNRLIIAFFLIVDGITFLLNPDTSLSGMAKNIILLVLLAAASVLITNLAAKVKDKKTIAISIAIIAVGTFFYIYPDLISAYIQLLLSLFIIYDGVSNISRALNLNKLSRYTQAITNRYNQLIKRKSKSKTNDAQKAQFKVVDDNINEGLEEQKQKLINPLKNLVNKTNRFSKLYIAANFASVILGIILLVYPGASMMIWGIIFLYTGFSNLIASVQAMDLFKKIKEKRFKDILFDANKNAEKNQKH